MGEAEGFPHGLTPGLDQQNPEHAILRSSSLKVLVARSYSASARLLQSASVREVCAHTSQKATRSAQSTVSNGFISGLGRPGRSSSLPCIIPICRVVSSHTWLDPDDGKCAKGPGCWVGHNLGLNCQAGSGLV